MVKGMYESDMQGPDHPPAAPAAAHKNIHLIHVHIKIDINMDAAAGNRHNACTTQLTGMQACHAGRISGCTHMASHGILEPTGKVPRA